MTEQGDGRAIREEAMVYQVRITGHLGQQWADWFEGLTLTAEDDGSTLLTGSVVDQAALHGLLRTVRDSGMTLLSVSRVDTAQADTAVFKHDYDSDEGEKNDS